MAGADDMRPMMYGGLGASSMPAVGGPIGDLRQVSGRHYPADAVREVEEQTLFFEGRARGLVKEYLRKLGTGLLKDPYPLATGLLQYVVRSLAVTYRSPATRYLTRGGVRLGDDSPEQVAAWEAYERSQIDAIMRHVDERRTLWRTCFVRLYPSDQAKRVKPMIYSPARVLRDPEPGEEGDVRADRRILHHEVDRGR